MNAFFSSALALFITMPLLCYILIFVVVKQTTKNHRKALNVSIHTTTFLLIASVHFLIIAIWAKSLFFVIILGILLSAVIFTFIHWKTRKEIIYRKVLIGFWRLNFLVFSVLYVCLLLYGVASRAIGSIRGI